MKIIFTTSISKSTLHHQVKYQLFYHYLSLCENSANSNTIKKSHTICFSTTWFLSNYTKFNTKKIIIQRKKYHEGMKIWDSVIFLAMYEIF